MQIHTGIDAEHREQLVKKLYHLLADTYLLYIKTQHFHWNVTGPQFTSLHALFEQFYRELAEAIDTIAERIRALGYPALGSYEQFCEYSQLVEEKGVPVAQGMIEQLIQDQAFVLKTIRSILPLAEIAADEATLDLATQRIQVHEKNAWILRSLLE